MPVTREQVRKNLISLITFQKMRERNYGELLLAVWHGIEDEATDVSLTEVYTGFASPEGEGHEVYRFPGMGNLWLPGLYTVSVYSRAEFERAAAAGETEIARLRESFQRGEAEVIWPPENPDLELLALIGAR